MSRYFHVYKAGRLTVIGFEGRHLADPGCQIECREELLRVVNAHACEVLVVDLMDVDLVSSWLLGVLAVLKRHNVAVELYHPSPEIREILATTHLDELLHVRHDLNVSRAPR